MRLYRILFYALLIFSLPLKANEFTSVIDNANATYSKNEFEKAIKLYQSVLDKNVESPEIYFNLGNAYFKTNSLGLAILNYERAKKLDPNDDDIATNLKLANQKTEDKIEAAPELFLKTWKNGVVDIFSEKEWSLLHIGLLVLALLFFVVYIISSSNKFRQLGFFAGSLFIILSITTFFIAKHKYNLTVASASAIIIGESVTVNGSPSDKGTKLFLIHEGTKVDITNEDSDWTEVKIANGNVGWIKTTELQKI